MDLSYKERELFFELNFYSLDKKSWIKLFTMQSFTEFFGISIRQERERERERDQEIRAFKLIQFTSRNTEKYYIIRDLINSQDRRLNFT